MQVIESNRVVALEIDAARIATSFKRVFSGKRTDAGAPAARLMHAWSIDAESETRHEQFGRQLETCPPEVYLG